MPFLDLATGLPRLWEKVKGQISSHNASTTAHGDIRDKISSLDSGVSTRITTAINDLNISQYAKNADLATIAKTGNVNNLIQSNGDVLVINGGTASGYITSTFTLDSSLLDSATLE